MDNSIVLEAAERLKLGLLAKATDGEYLDENYKEDLKILSSDNRVSKMLPSFARVNRSTADFRRAIQAKFQRYAERTVHQSRIRTDLSVFRKCYQWHRQIRIEY